MDITNAFQILGTGAAGGGILGALFLVYKLCRGRFLSSSCMTNLPDGSSELRIRFRGSGTPTSPPQQLAGSPNSLTPRRSWRFWRQNGRMMEGGATAPRQTESLSVGGSSAASDEEAPAPPPPLPPHPRRTSQPRVRPLQLDSGVVRFATDYHVTKPRPANRPHRTR